MKVLLVFLLGGGLYFLPSIIAFARKDAHANKILFLNVLGAWTGILWFFALGWALFYKKTRESKEELRERQLLQFIRERGGRVTIEEVAASTPFGIDDVKREFDRFCALGMGEVCLTEAGSMVYVFHGFLSEIEKHTATSIIDNV
ncbi:MAG: hypothetical protein CSA22_05355 [Deltaproteobacteria bacterium]|nr:MAG: hypothetical protein CSA22_05355 [Deltaproteobacteria bacterium]